MKKPPKAQDYRDVDAFGLVEIELGGKTYQGSYSVNGGMVTVSSAERGTRTTQFGGSTAYSLAPLLLREIVECALARAHETLD